jgi:hypothetical protein
MAVNVKRRYGALRIISWVFRVLAILVLIVSIVCAISAFVRTEKAPQKATSMLEEEAMKISPEKSIGWIEVFPLFSAGGTVGDLILGIIGFIMLYAFGELISLLIALEENTRRTSLILEEKG